MSVIVVNPKILGGKILGTRISVEFMLELLASEVGKMRY